MRRTWVLSVLVTMWWLGSSAAAQTPAAPARRPPVTPPGTANDSGFFVGGIAGASSVQNVGGLFGGELGMCLSDRVDIFAEGLWMQDVVTRRRLGTASTIGAYLQSSQGRTATATVTAPASYGGAGVRLVLTTTGNVRPYVAFGVGAGHIAFQPAFTLAGSDVTSSLKQYGITLGSDVTGEVTKPAFTGGAGVRFAQAGWYIDGGFRVISIRTSDQAVNVLRASASVGLKF